MTDEHRKALAEMFPTLPPRFNIELPSIPTYVAAMIRSDAFACVEVRFGDGYCRVFKAEHAIQLGEFLIEQGKASVLIADALRPALDAARKSTAAPPGERDT